VNLKASSREGLESGDLNAYVIELQFGCHLCLFIYAADLRRIDTVNRSECDVSGECSVHNFSRKP
jgi:hypothetical protein